jgi:hypothetical protein
MLWSPESGDIGKDMLDTCAPLLARVIVGFIALRIRTPRKATSVSNAMPMAYNPVGMLSSFSSSCSMIFGVSNPILFLNGSALADVKNPERA